MPDLLYRVGFASCARIDYEDDFDSQPPCKFDARDSNQSVWGQIAEQHRQRMLDAMLLLRDQVYSDHGAFIGWDGGRAKTWSVQLYDGLMYTIYQTQHNAVTGFKKLFEAFKNTGTEIGATWDDHDFGYNNGCDLKPQFLNTLGSAKALFEKFVATLSNLTPIYSPKPPVLAGTRSTGVERITFPITLGKDVEILLDGRFYRSLSEGNKIEKKVSKTINFVTGTVL